ncbi:MAG TPA: metallophosphoesterase, partial [Longimicrobiaceae bacterium]|nr:metallophosphoesterase [Longimicrobiaceae bacterium]
MRSTLGALALSLLFFLIPACGRDAGGARGGAARADAAVPDSLSPRSVYGATAVENVRVVPVEIEVRDLPPGWSGMRIAALSDFQLGLWSDNEQVARAAVEKAVAARPDIYVLLGDYVARGRDYAALERVLAPLRGKPVFAVLGHADDEDDPRAAVDSTEILTVQALARAGVTVLRNARARYIRQGDTAFIAGVEPYLARRPDWRKAEVFAGLPASPVLLTHMPVVAALAPTDKYPAILSGHTFCGQVEVPGTPRLTWLNTEVFPGTPEPGTRRIYRIRGNTLFVTCGVGFSFIPVRLGAAPEV